MRTHSVLKCQKVQQSDLVLKGLIRIKRVIWPYVLLELIINTEIKKERAESSVSILMGLFFSACFPRQREHFAAVQRKCTPDQHSFNWNARCKM